MTDVPEIILKPLPPRAPTDLCLCNHPRAAHPGCCDCETFIRGVPPEARLTTEGWIVACSFCGRTAPLPCRAGTVTCACGATGMRTYLGGAILWALLPPVQPCIR